MWGGPGPEVLPRHAARRTLSSGPRAHLPARSLCGICEGSTATCNTFPFVEAAVFRERGSLGLPDGDSASCLSGPRAHDGPARAGSGGDPVLWAKLSRASVPGAFFTKELELGAVAVKLEIWDTAGQEKYHSVCRLYFRGASGAILVYDITRREALTDNPCSSCMVEFVPLRGPLRTPHGAPSSTAHGSLGARRIASRLGPCGEGKELWYDLGPEARRPGRPASGDRAALRGVCRLADWTDSFCKAQQWLQDLEREAPPGEVVVMLVGNKTDVGERREVTFQEGKEFAESKKLLFMEASAKLNHQVTEVFSTIAQELLQREDRKKAQPQRGDAGLALKGAPAGQAGCCAH
uniref:RAB17, member RAS oncogene family n=1 Tax=Felis catus TaxID=9685 RepID=A0ABI7X2S2_FELCA